MQAPSSEKEHQDNYNGFDLLDEQIVVSAQQQSCRCNDWRICNESTALVDQSSWKICTEFLKQKSTGEIELTSVELQLIGYSWPDPSQHAIELVVFTVSKEDGYSERIIEKKRIEVDGQVIKEGTTFYGKNIFSNDRICDEKQFFKTSGAYIPCGLIIRILRRRQSFDELEERSQANKTLVVNGRSMDVDSHFLSIISPVFAAIFVKEKCVEEIEIKDVVSSEHFAEFLRALSPTERCLPNPSNVLTICELAIRFQVDTLLKKCERILKNCFEIPFLDRFLFADKHSLKGLMDSILKTMTVSRLKCFYLANKAMLDARLDLVATLLTQISREERPHQILNLNQPRPKPEPYDQTKTNYSEFDVLDEQLVSSVQQISCSTRVDNTHPFHNQSMDNTHPFHNQSIHQQRGVSLQLIRYESTAFVDQSRWKLWIHVVKADNDKIRLHSVELQLIGYSWPDPTRHAIELVVFKPNMEDGYGECIFEKKRVDIDGEIIKIGTTFFGRIIEREFSGSSFLDPLWNRNTDTTESVKRLCSSLACNEKQLFKIEDSLFPFGLFIRILKRRESFVGVKATKQWIGTDKTLIVKGRHFPVNTLHLATFSPVFAAMFESDMKEKCEDEIEIKDVESSEHFAEFLRALSPNERCLPNPSNVLAICELANRFQVETLLLKCEQILRNCFEIPFFDRFLFAEKHSLKGLMDYLMGSMESTRLKRFYLANKTTLDAHLDLVVMFLTYITRLDQADKPPKAKPFLPAPKHSLF